MDGFVRLFADIIEKEGVPVDCIQLQQTTLPGYYRPEKDWDLVVVVDGMLAATIEFKSHIGHPSETTSITGSKRRSEVPPTLTPRTGKELFGLPQDHGSVT